MGLNDLTLEKLIGEINGYKEKMRSIYEDYGRASQELQDRINVLGYNLNEHLKETKDQIASTPQRLLTLETKYVSGEVNEGEYRNQREEFKHLLERNLQSIEEIKSMITVLSHIEARPLNATDFRQTSAATPVRLGTGEEWGKTALTTTTPLPQPVLAQSSSPTVPSTAEISKPFTSLPQPTPSTPSWVATSPKPASIAEAPAPAPTPTINAPIASTPIETPDEIAAPVAPVLSSETPVAAPSIDASPVSSDDASVPVSTVDVIGDSASDDALMVKVVDDVPALEASAAVVSSDTSQIQPAIPGTDASTAIPSAPDVAQVSLTPPTQFYKVVCPKCGADVPKPAKVWELKGGKSKKNVLIGLFQCQDCRVKFREALTREII